jgi:hypothetical protein
VYLNGLNISDFSDLFASMNGSIMCNRLRLVCMDYVHLQKCYFGCSERDGLAFKRPSTWTRLQANIAVSHNPGGPPYGPAVREHPFCGMLMYLNPHMLARLCGIRGDESRKITHQVTEADYVRGCTLGLDG